MKKIMLILVALLIVSGCATKISDIKENPDKYVDKKVTVSGNVLNTIKIGPLSGYMIDDGTGQLSIASKALPAENTEKTVSGILKKQELMISQVYYLQTDE